MQNDIKYSVNWEKVSVYIAIMAGYLTMIFYISDMKERMRALEVKSDVVEYILKEKTNLMIKPTNIPKISSHIDNIQK